MIGTSLVQWLQGGFSIGDATLRRFYVLHYLLPFVIVGLVFLHLWAHRFGSNNPPGVEVKAPDDTLPFHPYFTMKDLFGLGVFLVVYSYLVFFTPDYLLSPDNSVSANPLSTPPHIVPEWYLLPYYAILRHSQQTGRRNRNVWIDRFAVSGAVARHLPRPQRAVSAGLSCVLLAFDGGMAGVNLLRVETA